MGRTRAHARHSPLTASDRDSLAPLPPPTLAQANPENTVGVMTMAGKASSVVVTPTTDLGKILTALHGLPLEGALNVTGLQVAQLALKHRQNKNQRQRIVLFCGSELEVEQAALVKIGKKLKKNNVAVDVVAFGDAASSEESSAKLEAFIGAVNSNDNSHLLTVPAETGAVLADALMTSPIMQGEDGGTSAFAAAAAAGAAAAASGLNPGDGMEFGIDPNVDPELALALRVSMEEERARQEAAQKAAAEAGDADGGGDGEGAAIEATPAAAAAAAAADAAVPMDEEDALLQQALQMSMMDASGGGAATPAAAPVAAAAPPEEEMDPDLAAAMAMSMGGVNDAPAGAAGGDALNDQGFVSNVLAGLPGVDMDDPALQAALNESAKEADGEADGEDENK